jgi:hypothetical protein
VTGEDDLVSLRDQLPKPPSAKSAGVIYFSPVPFVLTTNKAPSVDLKTTIPLPLGAESPGISSPPGVEVTRTSPPPSDDLIV